MTIETERLELVPLSPRQLKLWAEDLAALEKELGAVYRAEPMEGTFLKIVRWQWEVAEKDPGNILWQTFWLLIRKHDRTIVGSADFKDIPDGNGEVEIGYGLGSSFEHSGYMTEAVRAMCGWALEQNGVSAVIAETEAENFASQRVLTRCGFERERQGKTLWWKLRRGTSRGDGRKAI